MAHVRTITKPDSAGRPKPYRYEVRYRDAEGRCRIKGGFRLKRDAEAEVHRIANEKQEGTLVVHSKGKQLFKDVAADWLSSELDLKPRTIEGYQRILNSQLMEAFGSRRLASITRGDIDRFVKQRLEAGRQPSTIRNAYFVLKSALDYAVEVRAIRSNPAAGVKLPRPKRSQMIFLTRLEVRTLAAALDSRWEASRLIHKAPGQPPPYGIVIELAAFTGLRAGELMALRVKHVDFKKNRLTVEKAMVKVKGRWEESEPKSAAGRRTVGIPPTLAEKLRTYLGSRLFDREGYLFAEPDGTHLNYQRLYRHHFRPAVEQVLPAKAKLRFHDLRHTYASILVEQGAHPKEMAELMGHESVKQTIDRYSHIMPHMNEALNLRLDAAYLEADPEAPAEAPTAEVTPLR